MNKEKVVRDDPPSDSDLITEYELQLDNEEFRKALRESLEKQKGKYQQVLYMRYYEDLSIREISNRIGLPAPRVSERINYALKLLKKELEKKKILQYLAA